MIFHDSLYTCTRGSCTRESHNTRESVNSWEFLFCGFLFSVFFKYIERNQTSEKKKRKDERFAECEAQLNEWLFGLALFVLLLCLSINKLWVSSFRETEKLYVSVFFRIKFSAKTEGRRVYRRPPAYDRRDLSTFTLELVIAIINHPILRTLDISEIITLLLGWLLREINIPFSEFQQRNSWHVPKRRNY